MTDWADSISRAVNEHGNKEQQRADDEDRTKEYRQWHRTIPAYKDHNLSVADVDYIEYTVIDDKGTLIPHAVIELTRLDGDNPLLPQTYLDSVISRFVTRDKQHVLPRMVAEGLHVKAWLVLFRHNLQDFWVYNLTDETGWWDRNEDGYIRWLHSLRDKYPS